VGFLWLGLFLLSVSAGLGVCRGPLSASLGQFRLRFRRPAFLCRSAVRLAPILPCVFPVRPPVSFLCPPALSAPAVLLLPAGQLLLSGLCLQGPLLSALSLRSVLLLSGRLFLRPPAFAVLVPGLGRLLR